MFYVLLANIYHVRSSSNHKYTKRKLPTKVIVSIIHQLLIKKELFLNLYDNFTANLCHQYLINMSERNKTITTIKHSQLNFIGKTNFSF